MYAQIHYGLLEEEDFFLPAAGLACKIPVLFLLQLEKATTHDCFFPCVLFLRLMYGLRQTAAMG